MLSLDYELLDKLNVLDMFQALPGPVQLQYDGCVRSLLPASLLRTPLHCLGLFPEKHIVLPIEVDSSFFCIYLQLIFHFLSIIYFPSFHFIAFHVFISSYLIIFFHLIFISPGFQFSSAPFLLLWFAAAFPCSHCNGMTTLATGRWGHPFTLPWCVVASLAEGEMGSDLWGGVLVC